MERAEYAEDEIAYKCLILKLNLTQTNVVMQYDMAAKDSRFISQPDAFRPHRWLRESRERTPAYLTLPFGFGPRSCPGRRLAGQEVAIAVTKVSH